MIDIAIVASEKSVHQASTGRALVEGFSRHNIRAEVFRSHYQVPRTVKRVCVWGWRLGEVLRARGFDVLVIERGYIGDRFSMFSLAWNGLNNRGDFGQPKVDAAARLAKLYPDALKPWNPEGSYCLLIGQVVGDASLRGKDLRPWYSKIAHLAERFYGLPVLFRPHPMMLLRGYHKSIPGLTEIGKALSLDDCLAGARVVITYNSNTATDSILAGKPTYAADRGAMAWPVCLQSLSLDTQEPDRLPWAQGLAAKQWSLQEIQSGVALAGLLGPFQVS